MRVLLLAMTLISAMTWPALAQDVSVDDMSNKEIVSQASELHPSALYLLSARLLAEGEPHRVCRRPLVLSYAAMAACSSAA